MDDVDFSVIALWFCEIERSDNEFLPQNSKPSAKSLILF